MTLKFILICAGSLAVVSCNSGGKSNLSGDDASGIYVREYSIEVSNPETGDKLGMQQIRDSIFIEQADAEYKISNRKWRLSDYDQEGWVSMEHAEDRPLPVFNASFDETSNSLNPKIDNIYPQLFLEQKSGKLFKNKSKNIEYLKVK